MSLRGIKEGIEARDWNEVISAFNNLVESPQLIFNDLNIGQIEEAVQDAVELEVEPPKKRGRPRKVVEPVIVPIEVTPKKKPGRPKKVQPLPDLKPVGRKPKEVEEISHTKRDRVPWTNRWVDTGAVAADVREESKALCVKPPVRCQRESPEIKVKCSGCEKKFLIHRDLISTSGYTCDKCIMERKG